MDASDCADKSHLPGSAEKKNPKVNIFSNYSYSMLSQFLVFTCNFVMGSGVHSTQAQVCAP